MLELIAFGAAAAVGIPAAVFASIREKRRTRRRWAESARKAGMTDVEEERGLWSKRLFTARAGSHEVRFERYARLKDDHGVRAVIAGDSGLTLRAEKSVVAVERALGAREIELGEEAFDAAVFVEGEPAVLRAVLDVETRRRLRLLVEGHIPVRGLVEGLPAHAAVVDGDLVIEVQFPDDEVLRRRMEAVMEEPLALATRLKRPPSLIKGLVESLRTETEWRLRRETLRLMAETFPNHSATREVLQRACEDEHQEVQLEAALNLFDSVGQATLLQIASRETADDAVAAKAISSLGRALPLERALATLAQALRTRRLLTARACVDVAAEWGGPQAMDVLAKVAQLEGGDLALAAVRALGRSYFAGRAAEAALIHALAGEPHELRLAAAESLGRAGSAAAVLPLQEAEERDNGLRKAVREAVARIQARASGTPGQLSLAAGGEGQVSLADAEPRGRVSLDETE
jgi:hypothetical protein